MLDSKYLRNILVQLFTSIHDSTDKIYICFILFHTNNFTQPNKSDKNGFQSCLSRNL